MKIDNDINLKNYKKRKVLRIWIIIFGVATLLLSLLSLTINLGVGYALVCFIIMTYLTNVRNSTELINNKNEKVNEKVKNAFKNKKKSTKKKN